MKNQSRQDKEAISLRAVFSVAREPICDLLGRIAESVDRIGRQLAQSDSGADAEYLSIRQAASLAGLSATKIRREIKAGRLLASDIGTARRSHYRIRKTDLQSWMETNKGGNRVPSKSELANLVNRYFPDD